MRRMITNVVRKLFGGRRPAASPAPPQPRGPVVVRREEHSLSRSRIDPDALKVLNRLARFNHTAYLVGGGVRDLLLDRPVKDFDVSTSAHPNEVKKLFRNSRLIGRRFRLAHVLFKGGKVIEVATFRSHAGFSDADDLLITSDNTFGTPEEDSRRRDFTINGLFYSITDFSVIDFVGGLEDLERRTIRTIGDPDIRFREDPIRILRGIRLAGRLGFAIAPETARAMSGHREELWRSAPSRIVEEFVRILNQGAASASFPLLYEIGVLEHLLPGFAAAYARADLRERIEGDLAALDAHQKPTRGLAPGLALAVLYHACFQDALAAAGPEADRVRVAAELLHGDLDRLKFPRAQREKAIHLLGARRRMEQLGQRRMRPAALASKPWFPEALVLLEITAGATAEGRSLLRRWQAVLAGSEAGSEAGTREPAAAEAAGEGGAAGDEAPRPRGRRRGRGRRGRRRHSPAHAVEGAAAGAPDPRASGEDGVPDPDAAFGTEDTDIEPPGGGPPDLIRD